MTGNQLIHYIQEAITMLGGDHEIKILAPNHGDLLLIDFVDWDFHPSTRQPYLMILTKEEEEGE